MPIYEFQCRQCGKKTTALVLSRDRVGDVRCQRCGSADLVKLFSRFATPKSEDARLDSLADPSSLGDVDEKDPKSLARWMQRMGKEMGEDFGEDLEETMQAEMEGEGGKGAPGASHDDEG